MFLKHHALYFNEPDEPKSTLDQALEEWDKPTPEPGAGDGAAATEKPAAEPVKEPVAEPGKEPAVVDPKAPVEPGKEAPKEPVAPALDEKVILESPQYKELAEKHTASEQVLKEFRGALDTVNFKIDSPASLTEVLKDSEMLYDIMLGNKSVSELVDVALGNPAWTQAQKDKLILDMADIVKKAGVEIKGLDPRDPAHRELLEMREKQGKADKAAEATRVAEGQRKTSIAVASTLEKLCKEKGITNEDDIADYSLVVGNMLKAAIEKDPKILEALEAGNMVQAERLFTQQHNRELLRQKRWLSDKKDAKDTRADKLPAGGTGSGGAPPAEQKGVDKKKLATAEGRIEEATRFFKQGE